MTQSPTACLKWGFQSVKGPLLCKYSDSPGLPPNVKTEGFLAEDGLGAVPCDHYLLRFSFRLVGL